MYEISSCMRLWGGPTAWLRNDHSFRFSTAQPLVALTRLAALLGADGITSAASPHPMRALAPPPNPTRSSSSPTSLAPPSSDHGQFLVSSSSAVHPRAQTSDAGVATQPRGPLEPSTRASCVACRASSETSLAAPPQPWSWASQRTPRSTLRPFPVHDAGLLVQVPQRGSHAQKDAVRAALPESPVRCHRRLRDAAAEHRRFLVAPVIGLNSLSRSPGKPWLPPACFSLPPALSRCSMKCEQGGR